MKEQPIETAPIEVVNDTITNMFTYANYFLVAGLVVLLTYMTIRDFRKKQREKKLAKEREEYNRFEENDTLLTRQDHAMLYYGYSFTPAYKGSMDDFQDFRKLIKEEKYEDAYNIGKELLKKNPVSLQLLYNMYGIAGLLQKDIREIKHYSKRYAALLTMIALTGDGTSEETAFKVICVNDEYQLLNMLFKMENMKGQSLVNKCDLIEFDKCQYYEGNQMYFDISRSLDYMSELFGK